MQDISPKLEPSSSRKFFGKDYPYDQRPAVDVLHFDHPYPVIQDNAEFDRDFVKDENGDNGQFQAQQEYDRLRHKLRKEKIEAAKALQKQREEEQELEHAVNKYEDEVRENERKLEEAQKRASNDRAKKDVPAASQQEDGKATFWSWDWWPFSLPKWSWPESTSESKASNDNKEAELEEATRATEKSMKNLEKCKEELAKTQAELEKVKDDIKRAKAKQTEADAAVEHATKQQNEAEVVAGKLKVEYTKEEIEHSAAAADYEKQKAKVDKMKADLERAKNRVKAFRDAEDRGGGVYNTPAEKSFSMPASTASGTLVALLLACSV